MTAHKLEILPAPVAVESTLAANPTTPEERPRPTDDDIEAVIQAATANRGSPTRPPRDTRTQLFVGNLPYRVRWQDLKDLFRKAGTVLRADVSLGPDNRSRGYGTVLLSSGEDAGRAIDMFNGYNWQTRVLEVRPDRLPLDMDMSSNVATPALHSPIGSYGQAAPAAMPSFFEDGNLSRSSPSTSNRTLFVGNLPFHCQWQDLKDLFRQAGTILRADVALGQDGRSRGFGMVSFATDQDADQAVNMFNGYEYNGRPLKVHRDKHMHSNTGSPMPSSPMPGYMTAYGSSPLLGGHAEVSGYMGDTYGSHGQPMMSPFGLHRPMVSAHTSFHPSRAPSQLGLDRDRGLPIINPPSSESALTGSDLTSDGQASGTISRPPHPGSIAMPPQPPPGTIMMPQFHNMSPYGHPMTPLHGHALSPLHHHVLMTPHGMAMNPGTPYFMPYPSPGGPYSYGPPPPPHNLNGTSSEKKDASQKQDGGSSDRPPSFAQPPSGLTGFHMNGHPSPMSPMHHYGYSMGLLSPGLPFSPGVVMTPGAVWGSPARGGNPYINPAVGAPVHMPQSTQAAPLSEEGGYFPPVDGGYFPAVDPSANGTTQGGSGSSATGSDGNIGTSSLGHDTAATSRLMEDRAAPKPIISSMDDLLTRMGKLDVDRPGAFPTVTNKAKSSSALSRPAAPQRGGSDPTNVNPGPPAPARHVSADALGKGTGVGVGVHPPSTGISRAAPGNLNFSSLGLRVEQKTLI